MNKCQAPHAALMQRWGSVEVERGESDLHPEAIPRQSAMSLATAVGATQRLDYLYQHGQSQAVGAEAGALLLLVVEDTNVNRQEFLCSCLEMSPKFPLTFLSLSLLFFTSSLLPCPLPPPLPPPPPPPPPSPPPPAPAPGTAPPPWAPPLSPWPAGSLARASWFSLLSGLESFLPMPGTTPSCSRQSMMLRATSQILELMSWLRTA